MKKGLVVALVMALLVQLALPCFVHAAQTTKGGFIPFIESCCLGPRVGLEANEGKEVRPIEWLRIVPFIGIVAAIINGVEAYNGNTTMDIAKKENLDWYK